MDNTRYCATEAEIQAALDDAATQPISKVSLTQSRYVSREYTLPAAFHNDTYQFIIEGNGAAMLPDGSGFNGVHFKREAPNQGIALSEMTRTAVIVQNLFLKGGNGGVWVDASTHSLCDHVYTNSVVNPFRSRFSMNMKYSQCRAVQFSGVGYELTHGVWDDDGSPVASYNAASTIGRLIQCEAIPSVGAEAAAVIRNSEMTVLDQFTIQNDASNPDNWPKYGIKLYNSNTITKSARLFNKWFETGFQNAMIFYEGAGGYFELEGFTYPTNKALTLIEARRKSGDVVVRLSGIGYWSNNLKLLSDEDVKWEIDNVPNNFRPDVATTWADGKIPTVYSFRSPKEDRYTPKKIYGATDFISGIKSGGEELQKAPAWKNNLIYAKNKLALYGTTIYKKATSTQTTVSPGVYKNPPDGSNWIIHYVK